VSEGVDTKDEAAWRKVVSMGAQLAPEHDLFKGGAESDLDEVADNTIDDLDADLGLDDLSEEQPEQDVEEDTLGSLDLDDLQQDADTGSSEKEDDGLDFDLDFDLGEDKGESNEEEFTGAVELASDDELPKSDDLGLNLDSEFTELDAGVDDTAMEFDLDDLGGSESTEDEVLKIEDPMQEMGLDELDDLDLGNVMEESDQQDEGVIEFTDEELAELAGATEADETVATIQEPEEELPALDLGDDEVTDSLDLEELSLDQNVEGSEASGSDEINTKLDLARAYIDMGDQEGARDILDEVANEGNEGQRQEAQKLLDQIS
jgi:pilus assembly protein FimV